MTLPVLVAGVGNVFCSDDGFGVEVARRLAGDDRLPDGVRVLDAGIRGVHLAYELLDGCDRFVLVDAVQLGAAPGTVSVLEPADLPPSEPVDGHGLDPAAVLALVDRLGGRIGQVRIVGCEPATVGEGMGLSAAVEAAVPAAVDTVLDLLGTLDEGPR